MRDVPKRSTPNHEFDFETAAICRTGPDAGKVYATVTWGFTIDAQMKVTPKDIVYFNQESPSFDLAIAFWNAEAAGPSSVSTNQQQLPGNLH